MLADLRIWHLRKNGQVPAPQGWDRGDFFAMETCQRWIGVASPAPVGFLEPAPASVECYEGVEAYAFLLRLSCGLESQMVGETEVLGQVKKAWAAFTRGGSYQAQKLAPLFQKLFEDSKTIRRDHLQNLGQASYGSLVRRILTAPLSPRRPVLVMGAGAFAQSLLPWLSSFEVCLTNRTASKAQALAQDAGCETVPWEEALAWAARRQAHVLCCVPADDSWRQSLVAWGCEASPGTLFFDLGEPSLWSPGQVMPPSMTLITLDDLYALQKKEESLRTLEVQRARLAIDGLAARREATMHITLSHGWEDLWSYGA